MDECRLTRSPSISSFDTNHSSWSFVGEDDFDLLDEEEDNSASENEVNEMEEEDEQENDGDDDDESEDDDDDDNDNDDNDDDDSDDDESEDSTDDDDDISVVTKEDILNDPSALTYTDVIKVSEQLDELSKCFDSPFNQILEDFALERNIRFMAIISAAAIAMVIFYYAFGIGKPGLLSTENVCVVNEDRFLGLQYREVTPSFLRSFFETLLKPSNPAWSILPSNIPKPHTIKPFSWIFNAESISTLQDKHIYFATNQCERVSTEHQFSAESVRRYLRHTKKLKKPHKYESPTLSNVNETLTESKSAEETSHNGKQQMDLQKPLSIPKLILPIPTFLVDHLLIEPEIGLLTSVPSQELPMQREISPVPESITDLERVEKKCFEAMSNMKNIKSSEKKVRCNIESSSLFEDSKLRKLEKLLENNSEKEIRQSKKSRNEVLVISSVKKAISRIVKGAKAHSDKILEQLNRAVDNIARKNRPKTFRMGEKINIGKERCVLNSTCNVLASLARTLAGITLFPAIVGQTNAAKYINSLLDLSACTGLCLVCEKYWWTRECYPKERCTFLPWQRHFNTKRFLASQGDKMFEAFEELGWSIPLKKRKGNDGKLKFKFDHWSRSTGSEKEMRSRQSKKKLMERYSRKNGVQNRIY